MAPILFFEIVIEKAPAVKPGLFPIGLLPRCDRHRPDLGGVIRPPYSSTSVLP